MANGLRRQVDELAETKRLGKSMAVLEFIFQNLDETARLRVSGAANTRSNLKSEVFDDIARSVGVDTDPYKTKYHLLDVSLLAKRNTIAHGKYLEVSTSDYFGLHQEVTSLMRQYKNDLCNLAATDGHLMP